ncbi:hypothetical protein J3F81_003535 [Coemansia sp. RSA 371]|nr:hypothetical protein J3F81_003535 [Coemansia sp. RSA 371]
MTATQAENAAGCSASTLAWVAKLDCADAAVDATVALTPSDPPTTALTQPLWPGGRLRLLTKVRLDTVPLVLFTHVAFGMYINTGSCNHSKRYVNGLVNSLLPPMHTALVARIEGVKPTIHAVHDPFVDTQASAESSLPNSAFVVIYAEPSSPPRLVLHVLDASPERLELLAAAAAGSESFTPDSEPIAGAATDSEPFVEDCGLRDELAFVEHLARLSSAEQQDRIQRTLSAETTMMSGATALSRTYSAPRAHTNKRMTLSDIEQFAAGDSTATKPIPQAAQEAPSELTEEANKKLAKQLIIAALKERGITRDHADFAALWGQIYRSLKFALRSKISCLTYSVRDLRAEVDKHTKFYCTD